MIASFQWRSLDIVYLLLKFSYIFTKYLNLIFPFLPLYISKCLLPFFHMTELNTLHYPVAIENVLNPTRAVPFRHGYDSCAEVRTTYKHPFYHDPFPNRRVPLPSQQSSSINRPFIRNRALSTPLLLMLQFWLTWYCVGAIWADMCRNYDMSRGLSFTVLPLIHKFNILLSTLLLYFQNVMKKF